MPTPANPLWRYAVLIVTTATVRAQRPTRCNVHQFHVWRFLYERDQPADGARCQCGALTWTTRSADALAKGRPT